jgi:hypothetical protein
MSIAENSPSPPRNDSFQRVGNKKAFKGSHSHRLKINGVQIIAVDAMPGLFYYGTLRFLTNQLQRKR